ncbi:MAG: undecaprenyl-diphosphate phosphatase [Aggregatilineales bacterium]
MAEWIKVVILGIVEGITEFLPISSTGHLIVGAAILDFKGSIDGTFEIFIQLGAIIAVIGFYRAEILTQVRTVQTDKNVQHFWLAIIIAAIPAAIFGLLLRDWITEVLFSPLVVAVSLIIGGIVFLIVERRPQVETAETNDLMQITFRQALLVGVAQTLALIPGVSRSGASIIGGLYSGMDRQVATNFSFYLSIPVLGGATILSLLLSLNEISSDDLLNLIIGAIVSGIVAWFAIGWLLRYVAHNNFVVFGYYRIFAGVVIILLVMAKII